VIGSKEGSFAVQEEKHGQKAADATRVELFAQIPPVEKMDAALSTLIACE